MLCLLACTSGDRVPVFFKTFWLEKPKGEREYKLCVFDVDEEKSREKELDRADLVGETDFSLTQLVNSQSRKKFKLKNAVGQEVPNTLIWCSAKLPADPGVVSRFALNISARCARSRVLCGS